jgi:fructoselysine 6-kinase
VNVVCVGDCGVDRYVSLELDRPGGITLNFAAHARRLFPPTVRVRVVSALGTDPESRIVREALAGRDLEATLTELPGATSIQYINLEPSGEKNFLKYEQGVLGRYRVGAPERAFIAEADLLVAPHYRQIDGFFSSVMASPSRGLRAVDFADIAESPDTNNVERFLESLDIAFFGLGPEHGDLIDRLEVLSRSRNKIFIVTLGASGSVALTRSGRLTCPAAPVERVVDTTGAGDTFAAGFLAEYAATGDVAGSLHRGAAEAARTIQMVGAF